MDTITTTHIHSNHKRGSPALATPSPPESCESDSSDHPLPEQPISHSMQPIPETTVATNNHLNNSNNNSNRMQALSTSTPPAVALPTPSSKTTFTSSPNSYRDNHDNIGDSSSHQETSESRSSPMDEQSVSQKDADTNPPTVAATETSFTTAFPSLPSFINKTGDCNGTSNGFQRNKRPTRDRVLRTLSDALMRRSLTMIDLSQRDLRPSDATLIKLALLQNSSLSVLKLGYNNLCDEGIATLASGISTHSALTSLDLGFNNIGDKGCTALSSAILSTSRIGGKLHTLYLAGNCIGEEGAKALAQVVRCGSGLKRIHLTGNSIGPNGVKELMSAVIDYEGRVSKSSNHVSSNEMNDSSSGSNVVSTDGVSELYLGGTNMGHAGCVAVAKMLEQSTSLKVLSLSNCELNDRDAIILASAITQNCKRLPIEKIQLSFNNLTCKGIEALMNAVWGLSKLNDLQLDNNRMNTRGAQVVSAVLGAVKTLTTLNVGFNAISGSGIKVLMKAVAESKTLTSLTISGNAIDFSSSNAVAIALAHNKSLTSIFLDHCSIPSEGQRLITAGIVSNSNTRLQLLTGFHIGSYAKILRLPEALEHWTNEQVLSFILLMWKQMYQEKEEHCMEDDNVDPINLLPSVNGESPPNPLPATGPLDASTVVAVAKRAFETLGPQREEILSQRSANSKPFSFECPLAGDVIVVESNGLTVPLDHPDSSDCGSENNIDSDASPQPPIPGELFVRNKTESKTPFLDEPTRKKKIVQWLCNNMYHLNELSNLPFNDGELWRLHQHFVSPTIQDTSLHSNGEPSTASESIDELNSMASSAHPSGSILSEPCIPPQSADLSTAPAASEPVMGNLSMLKRKVSYRFLHEAAMIQNTVTPGSDLAVSKLIEDMNGHSMQPKSKRARRNRSRISIVPRIKKKLDSFLVSDHHRALGLMRQLAYVEKSLLNGSIYPVEDLGSATHLFDSLASDAEMILVDMM